MKKFKVKHRQCGVFPYSPARLVLFAHYGQQSDKPEVRHAADSIMSFAVFSLKERTVTIPDELGDALLLLLREVVDVG